MKIIPGFTIEVTRRSEVTSPFVPAGVGHNGRVHRNKAVEFLIRLIKTDAQVKSSAAFVVKGKVISPLKENGFEGSTYFEKFVPIKSKQVLKAFHVGTSGSSNTFSIAILGDLGKISVYKIVLFAQWNRFFINIDEWTCYGCTTNGSNEILGLRNGADGLKKFLLELIEGEILPGSSSYQGLPAPAVIHSNNEGRIEWYDASQDRGAITTIDGKVARFRVRDIVGVAPKYSDKNPNPVIPKPNSIVRLVDGIKPTPKGMHTNFEFVSGKIKLQS